MNFSEHETRVCAVITDLGLKALKNFDESRKLGLSDEAARTCAIYHVARAETVERKWVEHALDEAIKARSNKEVNT